MIVDLPLPWRKEIQFLGVLVILVQKLTTGVQNSGQKLYGALNLNIF